MPSNSKKFSLGFLIEATDRATIPLGKIGKAFVKLKSSARFKGVMARFRRFVSFLAGATRQIAGFASQIGLAFAGIGAGAAVGIERLTAHIAEISNLSRVLGLTTEQFQELAFAANKTGVTTDELFDSLEMFNELIGESLSSQSGEVYNQFKRLKIGIKDSKGEIKPTMELFGELADKLQGMSEIEKTDILAKVFGGPGPRLIALLQGGSDGLKQYAKEARNVGLVSNDFSRFSVKFQSKLVEIKQTLLALVTEALEPYSDTIIKALDWFQKWVQESKPDFLKRLGKAIETVGDFVNGLINGFRMAFSSAEDINRMFGETAKGAKKTGDSANSLGGRIKVLVDDFNEWLKSMGGAEGAGWSFATMLAEAFVGGLEMIKQVIAVVKQMLIGFEAWGKGFERIWLGTQKTWNDINAAFDQMGTGFDVMTDGIGKAWNWVVGVFESGWEKIKPIIDFVVKKGKQVADFFGFEPQKATPEEQKQVEKDARSGAGHYSDFMDRGRAGESPHPRDFSFRDRAGMGRQSKQPKPQDSTTKVEITVTGNQNAKPRVAKIENQGPAEVNVSTGWAMQGFMG